MKLLLSTLPREQRRYFGVIVATFDLFPGASRGEARRYRKRGHGFEGFVSGHISQLPFEQPAGRCVVRDYRSQVERRTAGVVETAQCPVRVQQQVTALFEATVDAKLAEIAETPHRAVDPGVQFEACAGAQERVTVVTVTHDQLVLVARNCGGVKRVRLAFEGDLDVAVQRIVPEQRSEFRLVLCTSQQELEFGGLAHDFVKYVRAMASAGQTIPHRRAAGRYADTLRGAS